MERHVITINRQGSVSIPCKDVWMSEMELVELFDVVAPLLRAAIRAVYRSGVLKPYEVERCIRLLNGYYSEAYALPMIVALSFRINTSNVASVCNTVLERLCLRKERQVLWVVLSSGQRQGCSGNNHQS